MVQSTTRHSPTPYPTIPTSDDACTDDLPGASQLPLALRLTERALVGLRHRWRRARLLSGVSTWCLRLNLRYFPEECIREAVLPGGVRLSLDIRDDWHRGIYYRGVYEPETTALVRRLLRPGDTFLDVGANAGYFACLAAGLGATIHAFEPNPLMVRLLCRSRQLNSLRDALTVVPAAASDEDGVAQLHLSPQAGNTGLASLLEVENVRGGVTVTIPTVRLDTYCRAHMIERVRLIKLDVEGGELRALRGATGVLLDVRPDAIICELGGFEEEGCSPEEVVEFLAGFDYVPARPTPSGLLACADARSAELDVRTFPRFTQQNVCFVRSSLLSGPDGPVAGAE